MRELANSPLIHSHTYRLTIYNAMAIFHCPASFNPRNPNELAQQTMVNPSKNHLLYVL